MRYPAYAAAFCAALSLAALGGCATKSQSASSGAPVEWDGLQRVQVKGLDMVYVKPGISLAGYTKIMVDPLQVSFSKARDANGGWREGAFPLNQRDRDRIAGELGQIVRKALVSEVENSGGYQIVAAPGPDVLHVSAAIIDLNVTNPDTMTGGRSYVISASKGSMTLVAELRDSESGELLARAVDRATDDSSIRMELANSVTNYAAAERAADQWAHILRQRLDAARAAGSGPVAAK
jgi:hypothetical protein